MSSSQEESVFSCDLESQSSFMNMDEGSSVLMKTQDEDMTRTHLNQIHQNINNQNDITHQVQDVVQEIHEEIAQVNDHIEHQEQEQQVLHHEIHELQQANVVLRNELQALRDIINARLPRATQIWYHRYGITDMVSQIWYNRASEKRMDNSSVKC